MSFRFNTCYYFRADTHTHTQAFSYCTQTKRYIQTHTRVHIKDILNTFRKRNLLLINLKWEKIHLQSPSVSNYLRWKGLETDSRSKDVQSSSFSVHWSTPGTALQQNQQEQISSQEPAEKWNNSPSSHWTDWSPDCLLISKFSLFPGLKVIIDLEISKGFTVGAVGNP